MDFGNYQNHGNNFNQENHLHIHLHYYLPNGEKLTVPPTPETVVPKAKKKPFFQRVEIFLKPIFWIISKLKWLVVVVIHWFSSG